MTRVFLNGAAVDLPTGNLLGKSLLKRFCPGLELPAGTQAPYLFCGNGTCRDCNLLVDGLVDIPACRVPLAPGMSLRSNDGNALARRLPIPELGEPIVSDVAVVGRGAAGRAVGAPVLEARAPEVRPAWAHGGALFALEGGSKRRVEARQVVLATGSHDVFPATPGVFPMDLIERYAELDFLPFPKLVLSGGDERAETLRSRLRGLGADAVEIVARPLPRDGFVIAVGNRREPALELARALGCRTRYDRSLGHDVLTLTERGETSVPGVYATGDVAERGLPIASE